MSYIFDLFAFESNTYRQLASGNSRFVHRQISMFFAIQYDTAKIAIIHKPAKILRSFNVLNQRFTI